MKRKQIAKKVALWIASISAVCIGCFVAPTVARVIGNTMAASQENNALPKITIDSEGYDLEQAPNAVVGKEYSIFNATAKDNYGNQLKVAQKVWLYYYSSTKSRITVQNGVFIPQQVGEYVVEYTAIDGEGNKASLIYEVECMGDAELSVSIGEKVETGLAGVQMQVAKPTLQNVSGKSITSVQATRKSNGESQSISDDLIFRPMYADTYIIEYVCSDYVTTASASYEITVQKNQTPVFVEEVHIPKYFVQNKTYHLDIPKAYHFAFGVPVEIEPTITVEDKTGNTQTLINGAFTPTVAGEIVVKYTVAYGEIRQELTYNSKIVNVDYGLLNSYHKYFDAENYTVTLGEEGVELFTMINQAEANFINPILVNKANVVFSASKKYKDYETLDIYFTDSVDSEIQVKFSFKDKADGGMVYTINDVSTYSSTATLFSGEKLELAYRNDECSFNLNETLSVIVRKTLSGADFMGFPSGKMYVSFRLTGVDGAAGFSVYKFNNQNFNLIAMDAVPEIVFKKHEDGEMKIGDVVAINPFYVGDVLDYESIVKFYVLAPDGNYVTATNGIVLDGNDVDYQKQYSIIMEMAGVYNVCMEVSDTMGNMQLYAYGITVVDRTPPDILLTQGKTEGKVGENIEVWNAKALDSAGEELKTFIYVYTPDGLMVSVTNGYFYGEKAGVYTVYYQAFDAKGNAAIECYQITVF